ncbi:hypothetical protein QUW15_00770 [Desulfovibrio piger]|nr:hypothetical protein [Desulfovibrio piger]
MKSQNERPSESLSEPTLVIRFLEETAGNYGTHATDAEYGHTVDGWNGLNVILAHVRLRMEEIASQLEQQGL